MKFLLTKAKLTVGWGQTGHRVEHVLACVPPEAVETTFSEEKKIFHGLHCNCRLGVVGPKRRKSLTLSAVYVGIMGKMRPPCALDNQLIVRSLPNRLLFPPAASPILLSCSARTKSSPDAT